MQNQWSGNDGSLCELTGKKTDTRLRWEECSSKIVMEAFGCGANHWESFPFCLTNTVHVQIGLTYRHTYTYSYYLSVRNPNTRREACTEKAATLEKKKKVKDCWKTVYTDMWSMNNIYISIYFAVLLLRSSLSRKHIHTLQWNHWPGHFFSLQDRTSSPDPSQGYPCIPVPSHILKRLCQPESHVLLQRLQWFQLPQLPPPRTGEKQEWGGNEWGI